jgi:hypothetical protein
MVSILMPAVAVAATIVVGGIADAQTMGEYANTTAMATASRPDASIAAAPELNAPTRRTWETNPWGGKWSDRVGNGGDFSSRASGGGESSKNSRWPGSAIADTQQNGGKRFDSGERFKSDEQRFAGGDAKRFEADSRRFPDSRFRDSNDMGLDRNYSRSGIDQSYTTSGIDTNYTN